MNPLLFAARVGGVALLTAAGITLVLEKVRPSSSDLAAGAIHLRRGIDEFQKGITVILFGSKIPSAQAAAKQREAARIPID